MTVSIVIPNYNGQQLLKKNLPKIIEFIRHNESKLFIKELIIVDDASTDRSVEQVGNHHSKSNNFSYIVLRNKKNRGFSSTVNRGGRHATGDIVVLLNTDVCPEPDFLKSALVHFKNSAVFAVGFLDKSIEGGKTVKRGRGMGYWHKGFVLHKRGDIDRMDTFWVSCGSGAFRRDMWNRLGGLDELYNPFYWEDIDLSYRAQKSGYTIVFEPKSVVIHEHEKGAILSHFSEKHVTTIAYRNQMYFVWKNITDVGLLLSHFFWLPQHTFHALLVSDWVFLTALLQATMHLPKVISHRRKQKKLYKKSDRELLS